MARCANCDHDVVEAYCARCGQRRRAERFSTRTLLRDAADAAFNLDSGLLHTGLALTRRPGAMVREYLAGRTRPYTNPAKYLIICAAMATFASIASGFSDVQVEQVAATRPDVADDIALLLTNVQRYFNLILILGLPTLPLLTRLFFRGSPYNFTEHLVFNSYVYAHQNLLMVAVLPAFFLFRNTMVFGALYMAVTTTYYIWACRGFFGFEILSTIVRGTLTMVLFTAVFVVGVAVAMMVIGTGGRP
jgi:hypothetical protein